VYILVHAVIPLYNDGIKYLDGKKVHKLIDDDIYRICIIQIVDY